MTGIRQLRVLIWRQTQYLTGFYGGQTHGAIPLAPAPETEPVRLTGRRPGERRVKVAVRSEDFLVVARELHGQGKRVAVLNMANARRAGGGVESGAGAQEENLFRRSDSWRALSTQHTQHYPIPPDACLLSKGVTIFRGPESSGYPIEDPFQVDVITNAAPAHPPLDGSGQYARGRDEDEMRTQIALIFEAAQVSGCQALILRFRMRRV